MINNILLLMLKKILLTKQRIEGETVSIPNATRENKGTSPACKP